ncbi:MAG: NAD(P)-dependent oxidoreductase [Pseudomonadota bacterium]
MQQRPITHLSGKFDEHAADTVLMLALTLSRHAGNDAEPVIPTTIAGKTLGLVGFDPTAQVLIKRASRGFGMRVLVHGASGADRMIAMQLGADISPSLDHLFTEADIVSLHGDPGVGATIVDAHRLNQMKPDACLINTAHGKLVDEQALLHALWFETIGGAGFAVAEATLSHAAGLRDCANAIVLPALPKSAFAKTNHHPESPPDIPMAAADNVIRLFANEQQQAW